MTLKRALYAARLYSSHHSALCVVHERDGEYFHDPVKAEPTTSSRNVIALYAFGKLLTGPSCR